MSQRTRFPLRVEELDRRDAPSSLADGPDPIDVPDNDPGATVHARGQGQLTSFNTATGQATTAGTIDTGVLRGTTQFSAQFIDAAGDYVGQTLIVTTHGTVMLTDVGTSNPDGTFTDHATIVGGTGKFAGATGALVFQGHFLADGVHFTDDSITGSINFHR
jgi:hypothetical protein